METVSSLSVAVRGIAAFLQGRFGATLEPVTVSLLSPEAVRRNAETSDTHIVNLFFYRLSPSGFHAGATAEEPSFLRLHALLTPFVGTPEDPQEDIAFRILGLAIRYLSEQPVEIGAGVGAEPFDLEPGRAVTDFLHGGAAQIVLQARMSDQHHRQGAATGIDDLHEPLEPVERVAVEIVSFVDEQHDRLFRVLDRFL